MVDLKAALGRYLELEREMLHARIDEVDDFDERWEAEGTWFLPPQPNGFDDSPFYGDEEDRELVALRTVFRITSHVHPKLGDAIVAHVSVPEAYSALRVADGVEHPEMHYDYRIAFVEADGAARVAGIYRVCPDCYGEGCNNENDEDGACRRTGWLHQAGVPRPESFGPATAVEDRATPDGPGSRRLLAATG